MTGKQLCEEGPCAPGGQQAENEPAVHTCGKGGHQPPVLIRKSVAGGGGSYPAPPLSTDETTSGVLGPVQGTPV